MKKMSNKFLRHMKKSTWRRHQLKIKHIKRLTRAHRRIAFEVAGL